MFRGRTPAHPDGIAVPASVQIRQASANFRNTPFPPALDLEARGATASMRTLRSLRDANRRRGKPWVTKAKACPELD